jgi:hypothetical protein
MNEDSRVISDRWREPIVAQKKTDGIVLRTSKAWLLLSGAELDRLFAFLRDKPTIQRYPVQASESPQSDEMTSP